MFAWLGFEIVCYLLADLLAGFWHFLEDRYFAVNWPIVGKYIAKPNELHHAQPTAFLQQGYWSRNWTTLLPAAIGFALCYPSPWSHVFLWVSQANEIHAWAHQRCSPWIRALQDTGVIQSPAHHGKHHRVPHSIRFCVMTDWLNPILDLAGCWRCLEWIIEKLTGIKPKIEGTS